MSMSALLFVLFATLVKLSEAGFEMDHGSGTIRAEDRDPFKEGYFNIVISCFALMFFFIGCMFSVRVCFSKQRGNTSKSFFLVA